MIVFGGYDSCVGVVGCVFCDLYGVCGYGGGGVWDLDFVGYGVL